MPASAVPVNRTSRINSWQIVSGNDRTQRYRKLHDPHTRVIQLRVADWAIGGSEIDETSQCLPGPLSGPNRPVPESYFWVQGFGTPSSICPSGDI